MLKKIGVYSVIGTAILLIGFFSLRREKRVDFSADVKPILNKHCISCHGGVKKNSGFSLLFEEEAFASTESGEPAIKRGDAAHSNFIKRLNEDDPELRMPYNAPPLSEEEIDVLTRWVNEGAEWGAHWAYDLPESVPVPKPRFSFGGLLGGGGSRFPSNIDYFIKEKHNERGIGFSPEA